MKKIKVGDIGLIALVVIISISIYALTNRPQDSQGQKYVSIQVDGKEVHRIELNEDTEETIELDTKFGHNVIEIKNNSVKSIEADCPDQIDVLQGAIYEPGEQIICLPNRMVVEIIADSNSQSDLDVINQ